MKFWIVGPTASGKTAFSIMLSKCIGLPIVNCDSRQFWKDLKHITCSPTNEEANQAMHLLFDELDSNEKPNLGWWCNELSNIDEDYILVGGTVFYGWSLMRGVPIESKRQDDIECYDWNVLNNMSPQFAAKINPNDSYRVNRAINFYRNHQCMFDELKNVYKEDLFVIKLMPEINFLRANVIKRVEKNIHTWIEEVRVNQSDCYTTVIGYNECLQYINGELSLEQLQQEIIHRDLKP